MNLIGNSCIASFITKDFLKLEFQNPFVWSLIDFESMYNLIKDYNSIDYKNYEIYLKNKYAVIKIDNKVEIKYVHYKLSETKTTVKHLDVYSKDILNYAKEKYEIRLNRMMQNKNPPIFILANGFNNGLNSIGYYTLQQCKKIQDLKSNFKIFMVFDYLKDNNLNNGKLKLLKNTVKMNVHGSNYKLAEMIYKKLYF